MGKILLNIDSLEVLLNKFFKNNKEFIKKNYTTDGKTKAICTFFVEQKECRVDFHLKNDGIKPVISGKNKLAAALLVDYIEKCGIKDNQKSKNVVIKHVEIIPNLIKIIEEDYTGKISITKEDNKYILKGFNNDKLIINLYKDKFVIQGKPYYTYNILINIIADFDIISFEDYVEINGQFSEVATPISVIREKIKNILNNSYKYMEEAQIKSISGTFSFINKDVYAEDYSSPLTGVFKALEGYIKKLLVQKFNKTISEKQSFSMFGKDKNSGLSLIDLDANLTQGEKDALNTLYHLYSDERNLYLHSTVDPKQMRIIEDYKEAEELRDRILAEMEKSYNIIFGA